MVPYEVTILFYELPGKHLLAKNEFHEKLNINQSYAKLRHPSII